MKLVTIALEWTAERGEADVSTQTLKSEAPLLTLCQDAIQLIDEDSGDAGQAQVRIYKRFAIESTLEVQS